MVSVPPVENRRFVDPLKLQLVRVYDGWRLGDGKSTGFSALTAAQLLGYVIFGSSTTEIHAHGYDLIGTVYRELRQSLIDMDALFNLQSVGLSIKVKNHKVSLSQQSNSYPITNRTLPTQSPSLFLTVGKFDSKTFHLDTTATVPSSVMYPSPSLLGRRWPSWVPADVVNRPFSACCSAFTMSVVAELPSTDKISETYNLNLFDALSESFLRIAPCSTLISFTTFDMGDWTRRTMKSKRLRDWQTLQLL